ncbi:Transcriptional regulator ManR [Lentibacillus sp. JNUCC-1]|nr:Transcriptional regulator ManR [Lentibacillus sp. JNUCC-1]
MNDRQKKLLHILLTKSDMFFHIKDLAEQLHCSEKTIRNDLSIIEQSYSTNDHITLLRKPGTGISLQIDEAFKSEVFQNLLSINQTSERERVVEIAYQLLSSPMPLTLSTLAQKYYTNKTIIKDDLNQIKNWLTAFHLTLESKQRVGSTISGDELNKRNALANLSSLTSEDSDSRSPVLALFPQNEITLVRKTLKDLQQHFGIAFTDGGFDSLLIHTLIMIKRIKSHSALHIYKVNEDEYASLPFNMTAWFLDRLKYKLNISFPKNEQTYFSAHLLSAKIKYKGTNQIEPYHHPFTRKLTDHLIYNMDQSTQVHFQKDPVLHEGLMVHLHSAIHRIKFGFPIMNPY